jgi:Domain of unknown function (DUF3598)
MRSQWDCLLQNLGVWQGSFTGFSPHGELLEDTPSVVSLEGLDGNKKIRQIVRRFLPRANDRQDACPTSELQPQDLVLEYSSLNRTILFFDGGAFSQGSMQLAPFSEFGAELALINGDRRLRLVLMYNRDNCLDRITLMREKLGELIDQTPAPQQQPQSSVTRVKDLLGVWQGEAVTLYPDLRSPDTYSTELQLHLNSDGDISQTTSFVNRTITSIGRIDGSIIHFDQGSQPVQVLLLPDGATATFPPKLKLGQKFFLEVGWLHSPSQRQRLIRSYDEKGGWASLTLVTERTL